MTEFSGAVNLGSIADIKARLEQLHQSHKEIRNLVRIGSGRPGVNLGDLQSRVDTRGLAETHVEKIIQALAQFGIHTHPPEKNIFFTDHIRFNAFQYKLSRPATISNAKPAKNLM